MVFFVYFRISYYRYNMHSIIKSALGYGILFLLVARSMGSDDDHDDHEDHGDHEDIHSSLSEQERWGYSFLGTFLVFISVFIPPLLFNVVKKDQLLYLNSYFISFGAGAILAVLFVDLLAIVNHTIGITWKSMSVLLASYLISLLFAFGIRTEEECCENHHDNEKTRSNEQIEYDKCVNSDHKDNMDHCVDMCTHSEHKDNTDHCIHSRQMDIESVTNSQNANQSHISVGSCDNDEGNITQHNTKHISPIVVFSDSFCNFVDGMLIVIAFSTCSAKIGWEVTGAILMHEIPHEIGDFAILIRAYSYNKSIMLNALSGTFALIGCLVGNLIVEYYDSEEVIGYILSVGIGGLMFVSTNILPRAIKSKNRIESMSKCFTVFMGMAIVTALLSQHTECDHDH